MSNQRNFEKDPDAIVDFSIDWSDWLDGDVISNSSWTIPTGLVNVSSSNTSSIATVFLSSGTVGQTYEITNRIVTTHSRVNDQTIDILVKQQ